MAKIYDTKADIGTLAQLTPYVGKSPLSALSKGMSELDAILTKRDKEQYTKTALEGLKDYSSESIAGLDITRLTDAGKAGVKFKSDLFTQEQARQADEKQRQFTRQLAERQQEFAEEKEATRQFEKEQEIDIKLEELDIKKDSLKAKGAKPKDIQAMEMLGYPLTQEGFQAYKQAGMRPSTSGMVTLYKIENGKLQETIVPKTEANQKFTEGFSTMSPEDLKKQAEMDVKKIKSGEMKTAKRDVFMDSLSRIEKLVKEDSALTPITGIVGSFMQFIPGTERERGEDILATVKANISFDSLQNMRDASPTGGALGQVSERELTYLQSTIGEINLNQSPKEIAKQVSRLRNAYDEVIHGVTNRGTFKFDNTTYNTGTISGVEHIQNPKTGKWFPKTSLKGK